MDDALRERVDALERAVTDGEGDLSGLADRAAVGERLDKTEDRVGELEDRIAELEAATQAIRGYVGNIRSVNRDVEQRADTALAKVESLESRHDLRDRETAPVGDGTVGTGAHSTEHGPEDNCGVCGRSRSESSAEGGHSDPFDPGGFDSPSEDQESETLEPGTIQRIRNML